MTDLRPLRAVSIGLCALIAASLGACANAPTETAAPAQTPSTPMTAPQAETPIPVPAKPLMLKPNYPERYVVVKGDTLWDISTRFLEDPWRWPELWQNNPQIANPHLIYPGDVLTLIYVDGKPTLQVQRQDDSYHTVKLSPRVRIEPLARAIPTIPANAIKQFLVRARVVTSEELEQAPYILSSRDEHLMTGVGNRIYVRGVTRPDITDYEVLRAGQTYRDPDNGDKVLGHEAIHVAVARLQRFGNPSTFILTTSDREALTGDRLLPLVEGQPFQDFYPHAPKSPVTGRIISVFNGVSMAGQFQVVVLNKGSDAKLETGNVLAVNQDGPTVRDTVAGGNTTVKLPDERAGLVMVFRVFDQVSYALVMTATHPIHVRDQVTNP